MGTQARARLNAFFARGGGYIATSQSGTNLTFLTAAVPALVNGTFTQGTPRPSAAPPLWANTGGADSPLTGAFPAQDYLYLPSNVTYFSTIPTGASVDGRYPDGASEGPLGPTELFVTGLGRARDSTTSVAAAGAPVIVHGETSADSRYLGFATNPFSRGDFSAPGRFSRPPRSGRT